MIPDSHDTASHLADFDDGAPLNKTDSGAIENLTVAQFIGQAWRAPVESWQAFLVLLRSPAGDTVPIPAQPRLKQAARSQPSAPAAALSPEERRVQQRAWVQLGLRLSGLVFGLYGSGILATERMESTGLHVGAPFLLLAFLLWLVADGYVSWPAFAAWRARRRAETPAESDSLPAEPERVETAARSSLAMRLALAGVGLAFCWMAAVFNGGNRFSLPGVAAWVMSVTLWTAAFAPVEWGIGAFWRGLRGIRFRPNGTFWALAAIVLVGATFRLHDLGHVPPEMTSDHVEKLLDAQRVLDGNPQVFFPNNGGREPFQMYAMALFSRLPGLAMDFHTLKLLSAIEGIITLPVLWWMGRAVIGCDNPRLGNAVGLALAALVAVSYWHVALSRLGLRIVLTPLVTALLIIFLGRALRHNRRGDFILAGLVLGFGLYTYQAVRMLPVVVVLGVVMAVIFWSRTWLERGRYIAHLGVLVVMAVVVFVPMLYFSIEYPNYFWMRTAGRLLGDDIIQTTDEQGRLIERIATFEERIEAFQRNLPVLLDNIRNALLMYNWKGDVLWFNAAPNRPAMDPLTATLFIAGLAVWLARMVRRRDILDWLLPPLLFIMLLPSAFSIAYPIENPSATRTSGTLPAAYLFAALPLAVIAMSLARALPGRRGLVVGVGGATVVVLGAYGANWNLYFQEYYRAYFLSSPAPYSEAGRMLRGFADSGGSYGNAFMLASPFWWDHRAVGLEAGLLDWPNGIADPDGDPGPLLAVDDVPRFLYLASLKTDRYRFDPERDILFFYALTDDPVGSLEGDRTGPRLRELFPSGYSQRIQSYKPGDDFNIFRVPALGTQNFIDFVVQTGAAG